MEQLDLPAELAGVPRMELMGSREFYMEQHRGVLSYSTEAVEINGGDMVVRLSGRELQLLAMTETELRIGGRIEKMELIE
ncbi:MAG: YabP/YqfC family sporulation protein [Clostridiales bacterium]|nr:YabP/YqfC family sporulation protein [Candidatus Cacconaster stercorequi]